MDGTFDGNSEDEDEYVADAKRQRIEGKKVPPQSTVRLLPRAGCGVITVVATADLHRHHEEHYLANNSLNLAEWFESSQSPAHVDLAVFAGDLGLELEAESTSKSHTRSEVETLASWRGLLARMLASKPAMHVIIVGGNHDGLLCADDKCLACRVRHGRQPSAALRANLVQMLEGLPAGRVHVLFDQAADVQLANGHVVRVVGSPWTSYNTGGREHLSGSHFWRPEDGFVFGGATLGLPEERLDCAEWWRQHWASIGSLLSAQSTQSGKAIATSVLVTHTPPKGVMDIVGGTKDNSSIHGKRVGCDALRVMLEGLERPPLIHCFGHVHAKQRRDEPPEGPRLAASRRVPGTVFANVAAERQLPAITGYRLLRKAAAGAGAAAKLDAGELLALPAPDATAPVPAPELLMRPPVALTLPLNGFACDCAIWADNMWQVGQ